MSVSGKLVRLFTEGCHIEHVVQRVIVTEQIHGIAAVLFTPVHICAHVEVLASLTSLVDANGLEVLQQLVFVVVVLERQHGEPIHIVFSVEHFGPVVQADLLIVRSAIIPVHVISSVVPTHVDNALAAVFLGLGFDADDGCKLICNAAVCIIGVFHESNVVDLIFIVGLIGMHICDGFFERRGRNGFLGDLDRRNDGRLGRVHIAGTIRRRRAAGQHDRSAERQEHAHGSCLFVRVFHSFHLFLSDKSDLCFCSGTISFWRLTSFYPPGCGHFFFSLPRACPPLPSASLPCCCFSLAVLVTGVRGDSAGHP